MSDIKKFRAPNSVVCAVQCDHGSESCDALQELLGPGHVDESSDVPRVCVAEGDWRTVHEGCWVVRVGAVTWVLTDPQFKMLGYVEYDELEATAAEILAQQPAAVQLVIQTLCAGTRMEMQDNERLRATMREQAEALNRACGGNPRDVASWFGSLRAIIDTLRGAAIGRE